MHTPPFAVRSFIGSHDKDWGDPQFFMHSSIEITAVLEGSGYFCWDEHRTVVEAGQVVLIPSDISHSFHAVTPIRFGVILIDGMPSDIGPIFHRLVPGPSPITITLSKMDRDEYERLFHQWLHLAFSVLKDRELTQIAWIRILLLFLFEHSYTSTNALSMIQIADLMRQNLREPLPISDFAKLASLSEEGFRKKFYKVYGMTPKQYQQTCRLTEAKWLLSAGRDMQTIADAIGFLQLHSFSSWFKKLEGMSPSDWRASQRLYHE